jgi:glutathione peroxidase-family protein
VIGFPSDDFHQELGSKYLLGRDGRLIERFDTAVAPDAPELRSAVEAALRRS